MTRIKEAWEGLCQTDAVKMTVALTPAVPAVRVNNRLTGGRLARERQTMAAMVGIYCRNHHQGSGGMCTECRQFLDYADVRLERCRFGDAKPTCANCPVHCYQRERREQARAVMLYAGPRMLWEHPILSLCHWLDGFRKVA